jgi:hypothetical protein
MRQGCETLGVLGQCRYTEEEIAMEIEKKRWSMLAEQAALSNEERLEQLKDQDDTHAIAKRKEAEMANLAKAFGVEEVV